jgi:hypothetical protein
MESLQARTQALREDLSTTLQAFDDVHVHARAITDGVCNTMQKCCFAVITCEWLDACTLLLMFSIVAAQRQLK